MTDSDLDEMGLRSRCPFHWNENRQPSAFCPKPTQPNAHAQEMLDRYHAGKKGVSLAEYRASKVLVVNPYSNIASSTVGAGDKADQIRRGGR